MYGTVNMGLVQESHLLHAFNNNFQTRLTRTPPRGMYSIPIGRRRIEEDLSKVSFASGIANARKDKSFTISSRTTTSTHNPRPRTETSPCAFTV